MRPRVPPPRAIRSNKVPATSLFTDHANTYAAWSIKNPVNNKYDRPTILRLAGDLTGKHVLELGCAAGGLTAHLVEQATDVLSVDAEPQMIELARQKLGKRPASKSSTLNNPHTSPPAAASMSSWPHWSCTTSKTGPR